MGNAFVGYRNVDWRFLALTAKHVIDAAINIFGAKQQGPKIEIERYSLRLYQVLPGPIYRVWNVSHAWICPSDIAILHLGLDSSELAGNVEWKALQVRAVPPLPGWKVLAFGYRESKIEVTEGVDGTHHIVLNDSGLRFPERRDSSMLTFPCFEVYAGFAPGMSGGLIIDEDGALYGLVCAGAALPTPPPHHSIVPRLCRQ